ncbi:beta-ketoacyl-[acyl-carrier-protein] synthase family protein [Lentzea sp. NBRC 102530]|uniref:beta-ketoacyl-[acyl-carrier-protein] synthase family protein n=1 Tax=Lentzea sp. NBRC 102530 TaxID=3032201 RepID=UPI0024A2445A|nr:beta-ketoacyl-[acyl-carrier-protein] synthase family protein [Lentzea sp. NBRC 102530]GLY46845.1 actinorhodin polyketide putative beta-ketoacyl synthase 1 [Lentzea sp. NBRC 102530]
MNRRRVVVTGLGVVAPGGVGADAFWSLLSEGRTATRRLSLFDPGPYRSQVAAEVDFDPYANGLRPPEVRRMDRAAQFAVVSTRQAVADSGIDLARTDPYRVAVAYGSAVGGSIGLESEYRVLSDDGQLDLVDHRYAAPHLYNYVVPSSFVQEVANDVGAQGPGSLVSTGCTSGIDVLGYAAQLIRDGSADVVVTGAADAPITPITSACFDAVKATSVHNDSPETASRPYDRSRNGFVLGEGGAGLVLEEYESAKRRGARIYAEIGGYATYANAFHMTGLKADGAEMAAAITAALGEARVNADQVDYVNAHGTATKQNDVHETAAFKHALGDHAYRTPVSSIKSMIGHSLGAIGSIEAVACLLAMQNDVVPPTANLHEQDPALDLDYVPLTARDRRTDVVVCVGSGFGGFQSALVLHEPGRAAA